MDRPDSAPPAADAVDGPSLRQLQLFIEHAPAAIALFDRGMHYLAASRRWIEDYGLRGKTVLGRSHYDLFPDLPDRWRDVHRRALAGEVIAADNDRFERASGDVQWLRWEVRPWYHADTTVGGITILAEDITARKVAEASLRDSQAMLTSITDNLPGVVARVGLDLRFRYASPAYRDLLAVPEDGVIGRDAREVLGADVFAIVEPHVRRALAGETVHVERPLRRHDGRMVHHLTTFIPDRGADGAIQGFFVVGVEITDRVLAEQRHVRQRNALITLTSQRHVWAEDATVAFRTISEEAARTLGVARVGIWRITGDRGAIECQDLYEAGAHRHSSGARVSATDHPAYFAALEEADASGDLVAVDDAPADARTSSMDAGYLRPLGIGAMLDVPIHVRGGLVGVLCHEHVDGPRKWLPDEKTFAVAMANLVSLAIETADRRQAERELRASEERFRELAETVQEVFWIANADKSRVLYISPAYEKVWGRRCETLYASPTSWLETVHRDDAARVRAASARTPRDGTYDETYRIVRDDGEVRWIRDRAFPVRNAAGAIERIVGVARDITDRVAAEEQLRQSQKMEAIGQLAGGVAHDFNNILAVILMQSQMTAASPALSDEDREGMAQIQAAAERAAGLTRQLLLFSRRQVMQARVLDLNEAVTDIARMLQRIIGEDVALRLDLHHAALMTRADAGLLDQILMNLAVNARDAMPGGGRLTIETSLHVLEPDAARRRPDATPGRYVCLSVSDTGTGIEATVLPHIFEPFFTTKGPGQGTGLGLATVFGIVQQHGGWIDVSSRIGEGTRFDVMLPAAEAAASTPAAPAPPPVARGTETILVVEDESGVRQLMRTILTRAGYTVLPAANGVEALEIWRARRGAVDLLVTDLVMPEGVTGHDLAKRVRDDDPRVRVLFISGYSPDIAGRELRLHESENFVQKPFTPDELLAVVRRCLDGSPRTD